METLDEVGWLLWCECNQGFKWNLENGGTVDLTPAISELTCIIVNEELSYVNYIWAVHTQANIN